MNKTSGPSCQLCQRTLELTFHHLIPRKMHRRTFFKKHYAKAQLQAGIMVCRLCHKAIHRFYDEMTLAKQYHSLELLLNSELIQQHLLWASKQKR
ncbi:MAG: hypothetical protein PHE38_12765 [Alishewanella agri]|nr:hypothetical protein [Alishewanella agri]